MEGCQPMADGVGTMCKQRDAIVPTFKIRNRTKGSPYTRNLFIKDTQLLVHSTHVLPVNKDLNIRAKALRKARNLPEVLFWMQVTKGRFHQIDFDRQKVIGNYIVDFYIKRLGLIIEIDGASHIGKEEYDAKRENYLRSLGLTVYRISTYAIKHEMGFVLKRLEDYLIENYGVENGRKGDEETDEGSEMKMEKEKD
jgi:very-short-patch-repair endonuclease